MEAVIWDGKDHRFYCQKFSLNCCIASLLRRMRDGNARNEAQSKDQGSEVPCKQN